MIDVLFVDDEAGVLEGLQRALRPHRAWVHTRAALGGQAALCALAEGPFDAVVSDLCMPAVDGADVLFAARDAQPHCARVLLTGGGEGGALLRVLPVVHRLLRKPCCHEELMAVLASVERLVRDCRDLELRRAIGGIARLPTHPTSQVRIEALTSQPGGMRQIASSIAADAGMSAKVLQLAAAPLLGGTGQVVSLRDAVALLDPLLLREVLLHPSAEELSPDDAALIGESNRHAACAARVLEALHDMPGERDLAFNAGLLHDIGVHALVSVPVAKRAQLERVAQTATADRVVHTNEMGETFAGHAALGAWLLDLWGMPSLLVDAVASHHGKPGVRNVTPLARDLEAVDRALREVPAGVWRPRFGGARPTEVIARLRASRGMRPEVEAPP